MRDSNQWAVCDNDCGVWLSLTFASKVLPMDRSRYSSSWWKDASAACAICQKSMRSVVYLQTGWLTCSEHGSWIGVTRGELRAVGIKLDERWLHQLATDALPTGEVTLHDVLLRVLRLEEELTREREARYLLSNQVADMQLLLRR
jgi:hypothetical protein